MQLNSLRGNCTKPDTVYVQCTAIAYEWDREILNFKLIKPEYLAFEHFYGPIGCAMYYSVLYTEDWESNPTLWSSFSANFRILVPPVAPEIFNPLLNRATY